MDVNRWSTTAANNDSAVPDGAPEGWTGANVNNWGRETMAAVRRMYEDSTYIEITYQLPSVGAKSLTRVSATRIDILACDATAYFTADRRIKIVGATTGYGVVVSSTFSTDTQVTVAMEAADVPTSPTAIYVHVDPTLRKAAFKNTGAGNGLDADTVDGYQALTFLDLVHRGALFGLKIANSTGDSANDIDVTTGACRDSTHQVMLKSASSLTKRMDATWAAGTGNGGRAAGVSYSANTWYHVFYIGSSPAVAPDVGFDTSVSAANLMADAAVIAAGHTKFRRIGSFLTNATPAIIAFVAVGDSFLWSTPVLDINTTIGTSSGFHTLASVPAGVVVEALLNVYATGASNTLLYLSSPDATDQNPSASAAPLLSMQLLPDGSGFGAMALPMRIRTDSSQRVRADASAASVTLRIATLGWVDGRGKDA